jgi:hypothetical protein
MAGHCASANQTLTSGLRKTPSPLFKAAYVPNHHLARWQSVARQQDCPTPITDWRRWRTTARHRSKTARQRLSTKTHQQQGEWIKNFLYQAASIPQLLLGLKRTVDGCLSSNKPSPSAQVVLMRGQTLWCARHRLRWSETEQGATTGTLTFCKEVINMAKSAFNGQNDAPAPSQGYNLSVNDNPDGSYRDSSDLKQE